MDFYTLFKSLIKLDVDWASLQIPFPLSPQFFSLITITIWRFFIFLIHFPKIILLAHSTYSPAVS